MPNIGLLQHHHLPRLHKSAALKPVEVDAAGDLIIGVVLPRHLSSVTETVVRFCGKELDRYQTILLGILPFVDYPHFTFAEFYL